MRSAPTRYRRGERRQVLPVRNQVESGSVVPWTTTMNVWLRGREGSQPTVCKALLGRRDDCSVLCREGFHSRINASTSVWPSMVFGCGALVNPGACHGSTRSFPMHVPPSQLRFCLRLFPVNVVSVAGGFLAAPSEICDSISPAIPSSVTAKAESLQ